MAWSCTLIVLSALAFAIQRGVKSKAPRWKHGALVLGCGVQLCGFWLAGHWGMVLAVGGCLVFLLGVPIRLRPTTQVVDQVPGIGGIHILFFKPRFFLADVQLVLLLDGATIYAGSFIAGVDMTSPAAPGQHRLESRLELPFMTRRRSWDIAVSPSGCEVVLEYSRFWGNFTKRVRTATLALASSGVA